MQINRTQSRNSVLGINTIILEEESTDPCQSENGTIEISPQGKFEPNKPFETHKKFENLSDVRCVAIIEDVEKMFDMNDTEILTRNMDTTTSLESSNAPSFSSIFNSIVPISDMKNRYASPDSNLSIDSDLKSRFRTLNDIPPETSPLNKTIAKDQFSVDGDFYKDPKNEATLSSALLLDESQAKFVDDLNKKKIPPPHEKVYLPRFSRFGAMPSCYVISKDDYFKSRKLSTFQCSDGHISRIKKVHTSSQLNQDQMSALVTSPNVTNSHNSNVTNPNYMREGTNNSSFFLGDGQAKNPPKISRNSITTGTQLIRGNSMVSVVNKGSSSMLILKIQSYIKNYMDINPDFGWRRLIDDKNLPFSNFSNNSYMFYIESKKSTHIISLANLAINIACRAFILAVTHGYLDLNLTPNFLIKYLPTHITNSLPTKTSKSFPVSTPTKLMNMTFPRINPSQPKQNLPKNGHLPKHYYYKGGVDNVDDECGKDTMYLKSNFLGIFAISSLVKNLNSDKYRNRYKINKKSPLHNLENEVNSYNEILNGNGSNETQPLNSYTPNTYYNTLNKGTGFYKFVPVPEYGWTLVSKAPNDLRANSKPDGFSRFFSRLFKKKPKFESLYPNTLLCKVRTPHHSETNCKIMVDAGSLGMNLAEQLYRLEISTSNREKFPRNTFGFSTNQDGRVTCPDGSVVDFVPEEVILNTASLVHEIYITQTYLIL